MLIRTLRRIKMINNLKFCFLKTGRSVKEIYKMKNNRTMRTVNKSKILSRMPIPFKEKRPKELIITVRMRIFS